MSVIVVIPVKARPDRKTRLAAVLDPAARDALAIRMASHVATIARQTSGVDRVAFLTAGPDGLPTAVARVHDHGGGLNVALSATLAQRTETRLVVLPGDLPLLTVQDVAMLVAVPAGTIAVAPDRHGTGTNALSLPLPDAADFRFTFGKDSLAIHRAEAQRLGLTVTDVRSSGLARDIDLPEDLIDARGLIDRAPRITARSSTSNSVDNK